MAVSQTLTLTQSSQSISGNSSKVRILWKSTQSGDSYNGYTRTAKYYVSINGGAETTYSVSYTLPKNTTKTIVDTTITVPHKADGTGTVKVRTWMDTNISAGVVEKSSTLSLDKIPRATTPVVTASSHEIAIPMGDKVTITLNRASESFTHDLAYSFEGGEYVTLAYVHTSYNWTIPDLATSIPSKTTGDMALRCITKNGDTAIGTKIVHFRVSVPDTNAYKPSIGTPTVTEATPDLAAQFGAFVKSKSALNVSLAAAGAKGSWITDYRSTIDGRTYEGDSFVTEILTTSGTVNLGITVTDSRGRTQTKTVPINVVDYHVPQIAEFKAYRTDANGVPKDDGKHIAVVYEYVVAVVNNKNTAEMVVEYKRSSEGDSKYSELQTSVALNGAGSVTYAKEISTDYQYDVRLTVTDWFGEKADYKVTLPTAKVIMDFKANGKGISFGKTSEWDGFEVDMPTNCESLKMVGVRNHETADGSGYILYNNGMLIQWGAVSVTPTAINTVTSLQVNFKIPYKFRPHITGTLLANSPQVVDWSLGVGTSDAAALSGLVVYMTRSTMHATPIRWMAVGLADATKLPEVTDV